MQDLYLEQIVKANPKQMYKTLRMVCLVVTSLAAAVTVVLDVRATIVVLIAGIATWFFGNSQYLEYEYIFVNGQLDLDGIRSNKRKRLATYQIEELICITAEGSPRLEGYKNQLGKTLDLTSGDEKVKRFALIFKDKDKYVQVLLEPEEELLQAFRKMAPHKFVS